MPLNPIVSNPLSADLAPTVGAGARATNETIGQKLAIDLPCPFTSGSDHGPIGIVQAAPLLSLDAQAKRIGLFLFRADYTDPGDAAAFAPSDADMEKCIGRIVWEANHWTVFANNAYADRTALGLAGKIIGHTWYGQYVALEALTVTTADMLKGKLAGIIT